MHKMKKMVPYLLVMFLDFYLLPLLIKDTGTAILILIVIVPITCFVCAAVYGAVYRFSLLFCVLTAIIFVPTVFIFYNSSAWFYTIGYGMVAIVGNGIGLIFNKQKKS